MTANHTSHCEKTIMIKGHQRTFWRPPCTLLLKWYQMGVWLCVSSLMECWVQGNGEKVICFCLRVLLRIPSFCKASNPWWNSVYHRVPNNNWQSWVWGQPWKGSWVLCYARFIAPCFEINCIKKWWGTLANITKRWMDIYHWPLQSITLVWCLNQNCHIMHPPPAVGAVLSGPLQQFVSTSSLI